MPSSLAIPYPQELLAAAKPIRLLLLDVDGVLTGGEIVWDSSGVESKLFSVKDGQGLRQIQKELGIETGIVTARQSSIVERRAKELTMNFIFQAVRNKWECVAALMQEKAISAKQIAYMGDDLPDLPVLREVGLPACPADAIAPVQESCLWVSRNKGGRGAVRELTDLLLYAQTQA